MASVAEPLLPPPEEALSNVGPSERQEPEVVDAGRDKRQLGRPAAVERNRRKEVRSHDDVRGPEGGSKLRERPEDEDVGIEIDELLLAADPEQMVEEGGLERRAQLQDLVLEDELPEIGEPELGGVEHPDAFPDRRALRQAVHDEHVEARVRLVPQEGTGERSRLGEIVPGDDRARRERRPARGEIARRKVGPGLRRPLQGGEIRPKPLDLAAEVADFARGGRRGRVGRELLPRAPGGVPETLVEKPPAQLEGKLARDDGGGVEERQPHSRFGIGVGLVEAVAGEIAVEVVEPPSRQGQPDPHDPVFLGPEPLVEDVGGRPERAPEESRVNRNADSALPPEEEVRQRVWAQGLRPEGIEERPRLALERPVVRVGHVDLGMSLQNRHLSLELLLEDQVVRVEKLDVLAGGEAEPGVARPRAEAIALEVIPESRIALARRPRDRGRVVGGPVVHNEALPVRIGLPEDALQRLREEPPRVERRDDDADLRPGVHE